MQRRAADQVHPEVAERLRAAARQPAHQRHRQHDAGGGGDELVKGQASHLRQVAHGRLASVVLPVGIGGETGSGVEGQLRLDIAEALRVEERPVPLLGTLEEVQQQHAGRAEDQHGDHVARPLLLLLWVDAAESVKEALHGHEYWREPGALPREDACHVQADGFGHQQDDD